MPARRCSLCGISYPAMMSFSTCPVHGEPTSYIDKEPDEEWKPAMERIQKQIARAEELSRHIPRAREVFVDIDGYGRLWVDQTELHRAGVRLSRMVPDQFHMFELDDGWIYETQGWDEPRRRWWVERVIRSQEEEASPQPTTSADAHSSTESATD